MIKFKFCSMCQMRKHTTQFYKLSTMSDGRENRCMDCAKGSRRIRYLLGKLK